MEPPNTSLDAIVVLIVTALVSQIPYLIVPPPSRF